MDLRHASTQQLIEIKDLIHEELRARRAAEKAAQRMAWIRSSQKSRSPNPTGDPEIATRYYNSSRLVSFRYDDLQNQPAGRNWYLPSLLKQDWSSLFESGDEDPNYYVYAHCDPRERVYTGLKIIGGVFPGAPFYVGKGRGGRAWNFKRNQGHGIRLREIQKAGYNLHDTVHFCQQNLTEKQAFEIESKLIYFFGTIYEEGRLGTLLNLDQCKRPQFVGEMQRRPRKKSGEVA